MAPLLDAVPLVVATVLEVELNSQTEEPCTCLRSSTRPRTVASPVLLAFAELTCMASALASSCSSAFSSLGYNLVELNLIRECVNQLSSVGAAPFRLAPWEFLR